MLPVPWLLAASRTSVLHERGNLYELDAGANAVETCHAPQERIGDDHYYSIGDAHLPREDA